MAQTTRANPAAPMTRPDLTPAGKPINAYRENPFNKDYHRLSQKAMEQRQLEGGSEQGVHPGAKPQTLDELFGAELLADDAEAEEEVSAQPSQALRSLQDIERQRKLAREKERQHELVRKGIDGRSLHVHLEPVKQLDGRQLQTTNPTLT